MFKHIIDQLNSINGRTVSIPIEPDEKGYLDKQCPSENCEFLFKVQEDDWRNLFPNDMVWCPFCRHEAPKREWFTIAQVEHAQNQALEVVKGEIHNAMVDDANSFNSRQPRNSFISISLKVEGGKVQTVAVPAKAAEAMQLEIICENCNARFSVLGSAFFCPACGYNSVTRMFADSLRKIRVKKYHISTIRQALTESTGKDEAELTCRSVLETCIADGVVAFQKLCEGLYQDFGEAPFNAFQRLEHGSKLWERIIGIGYSKWLNEDEIDKLSILFQKRHILSHNEGIVDAQYLLKSGDTSYKEGQRIVVSERDIDELLSYVEKLGNGLKGACKK